MGSEVTQFKIDDTFRMNPAFVCIAAGRVWLHKKYRQSHELKMMDMEGGGKIKKIAVTTFIIGNVLGLSAFAYAQL